MWYIKGEGGKFLIKHIGIDLGTANTLIFCKGKGIVLNEPSVVAISALTGKVLAVGKKAKEMIGRTPDEVVVVRPLKNGVIADFDVTKVMLREFIEKATKGDFFRPIVTVCVPWGVTEVERRAVLEALSSCGLKNAFLIEEPMAAALGADLSVSEAVGNMVVDIGGGTCEATVVSLGGIVASTSIPYGGDKQDEYIVDFIKNKYKTVIGERTAENIKINIGSAFDLGEEKEMHVMGRDIETGLPKEICITSSEVREAIKEPVSKILGAIRNTLENTPPELVSDIVSRGIYLTGGGANLQGLAPLVFESTGIKTQVCENTKECVAIGAGTAISAFFGKTGPFKKGRKLGKLAGQL